MKCYLFLFRGQKLVTPDEGILNGITRRVVLEIVRRDFPVDIREVQHGELLCAEEAFTPGSNREIVPVD